MGCHLTEERKDGTKIYNEYVEILKEELLPAMGCTEPIAVAYATAVAVQALGEKPESVEVNVSANIIKNVKSVVVPVHRRDFAESVQQSVQGL